MINNFKVVAKLGIESIINCVIQAKIRKFNDATLQANDIQEISFAAANLLDDYLQNGSVDDSVKYFNESFCLKSTTKKDGK